ncbi:MAG: metal-dependent hydrolase [Gemmatimonadales bacterium]
MAYDPCHGDPGAGGEHPDIDIIAAFVGRNLEWRRGLTHGVPALLIWPFIVAALIVLYDRWRAKPGEARASYRGLVILAAIGTASHPFLDFLNSYGMRWLMPMVNRWYYGDTLFIIDIWMYLILGLGWFLTARARSKGDPSPARRAHWAVAAAILYLALMAGTTLIGRRAARAELGETAQLMVAAVPINPFEKQLVADYGDRLVVGTVRLLPTPTVQRVREVKRDPLFPVAVLAASRTREGRAFLGWSRFTASVPLGGDDLVRLYDLRYSDGSEPSWASVTVQWSRAAQ